MFAEQATRIFPSITEMDSSFLILATQAGSSLASRFTWLDWLVVIGYLVLTTAIGSMMAGKQATIRDFFLGGRKLPWYAVSGANIATEISAVTFVSVPAIVFAAQGNFTYLQICVFGSVLARILIAWLFIPVYFKREIYSPYDYMADELGNSARTVTTYLFILGGALAQGSRVYLAALILDLIVGEPLFGSLAAATGTKTFIWSIYAMGVISVVWTYVGGITTVIWTDVILFMVFLVGALVSLFAVAYKLPGGWGELIAVGWNAKEAGAGPYMINWGKFTFFDFDPNPAKEFTFWTAVIASTWGGLGVYGANQSMTQRIFCCRTERDAKIAVLSSCVGQVVALIMLFVGIGLYAFYRLSPLEGEAAALVAEKPDRIFPVFIIQELPPGVTGLVIAGIFAAAISTLVSTVASFSQTTLSAFYVPWRLQRWRRQGKTATFDDAMKDPYLVFYSRILVIVWGLILCLMAQLSDKASDQYPEILNLALAMAGFTGGALLAGFLLAFLKINVDARGFVWSGPLSVLVVFAIVWHEPWSYACSWITAAGLLITWLVAIIKEPESDAGPPIVHPAIQTVILVAGLAIALWLNYYGYFRANLDPATGKTSYVILAWPWLIPVGSVVAMLWGYLLARARRKTGESPDPAH